MDISRLWAPPLFLAAGFLVVAVFFGLGILVLKWRRRAVPRLSGWMIGAVVLLALVALTHPQQLPLSLYKLSLVVMAGVAGYFLDCRLFPYARPDGYLALPLPSRYEGRRRESPRTADYPVAKGYAVIFAAAMIRRAIIVGGAMLAVGMGS